MMEAFRNYEFRGQWHLAEPITKAVEIRYCTNSDYEGAGSGDASSIITRRLIQS
jgi:hypothetical protein